MKKLFLLLIAICAISLGMSAQQVVRGQVTDANGEPLIGATIQPVGGGNGVATDVNGEFSLNLPYNVKTLKVSYVGYNTQELPVQPNMAITMSDSGTALDEVMVVAYGTAKKSSYTGSAQAISNKKIETRPITSVTKALEGNVGGIQVGGTSGQPGADVAIRIRGFGSINASNNPLYVVDGIPYDGSLSDINPNDIESMTVLKDASAAALYGARGANGVIMIQTKKGVEGHTNVTWRSTVGWSSRATPRYETVDQKEFVNLFYEGLVSYFEVDNEMSREDASAYSQYYLGGELGGDMYNPFKNYSFDNIINPETGLVYDDARSVWNEDWYDSVIRKNALRHEHVLSFNGGTQNTQFMFSLGYLNEKGFLKTTSFERYSARANVNSQFNDWLASNINVSLAHSKSNFSDYDDTSYSNPWFTAQFINPLFPVYLKDENGNNALDDQGNIQFDWGEGDRIGNLNDFNSLGMLLMDKAENVRDVAGLRTGIVIGSDLEKYGWRQGLKLAVNFGMDYTNRNRLFYMNSQHGNQANAHGLLEKMNYRTQSYTFNQLLTWTRKFNDVHNIDLLLGHEWYAYKWNYLFGERTNIVDGFYELIGGANVSDNNSYQYDYRINSFLSRFNYNYDDRYYLSASLRSDASSRFHKDHHTGIFWSLGANWRVSKESFMRNIDWIHNLSVKLSYGEQGNDNIGTYYAWQQLFDLGYTNSSNVGAFVQSLENREVSWEKNSNLNTGFEASLFGSRLRVDFEYFYKKTTDMLLNFPMALSTGFTGYLDNVGDMRNTGFELKLGVTPLRTQDFEWNIDVMLNRTNNKVLKLTGDTQEILSGIRSIKVGMPIYTYYMSKGAGVDPDTGVPLYWAVDEEGNEYKTSDYYEANANKFYLGSRIPKLYGSIGTDLTWKNLSLSILTTYSIGGKVYDSVYAGLMMGLSNGNSTWHKDVLKRWRNPGDITDVPRIQLDDYRNWPEVASDRYLIDASYFAIKNITLSYILPRTFMNKIGIQDAKVFASGDNLCLFTHLKGMDPQYNFTGGTNYDYSPNRTYTLGIELNFGKTYAAPAPAVNVNALNSQINDLRAQLADAQGAAADANSRLAQLQGDLDAANRALANCRNDLHAAKNAAPKVVDNSKQYMNILVHFPKSGTAITADQRANVERVAAYLKSHPEATCEIKGYASPEGKEDINIKLANGRAASVKDMLVKKYGIAANRINAAGQGISNMFDELSWNRVSICEIIVK